MKAPPNTPDGTRRVRVLIEQTTQYADLHLRCDWHCLAWFLVGHKQIVRADS
jgi:hypothetical protein